MPRTIATVSAASVVILLAALLFSTTLSSSQEPTRQPAPPRRPLAAEPARQPKDQPADAPKAPSAKHDPVTSYMPVVPKETFDETVKRMTAEKPAIANKHNTLLERRYDLADRPAQGVKMFRGKAVQQGPRVKLPEGITWEALAAMTPDEIRAKNLLPAGFLPLPHPNHRKGGMVFPKVQIDEILQQETAAI